MAEEPRFTEFPTGDLEYYAGNNWECWSTSGHIINRCDATTGHSVRPIAFCETPDHARELVRAVAIKAELLAVGKKLAAFASNIHPTAPSVKSMTLLNAAIDAWDLAAAKAKAAP